METLVCGESVCDLFCLEDMEDVKSVKPEPKYEPQPFVEAMRDPVLYKDWRVMANLLGQEEPGLVVDYFSSLQRELRPHMRRIVTHWMLEVCQDQEAGPEVFLLAVHYLDTFLSTTPIKKSQFQLAASTCLLLASKFSAVVPFSSQQLVIYSDYSMTVSEVVQWEVLLLHALQWQLAAPTALSLLEQLVAQLTGLGQLDKVQVKRLHRHATSLATLAATEHWFLGTKASVVAGAALVSAYRATGREGGQCLVQSLAECLHCGQRTIEEAAEVMDALVEEGRIAQAVEVMDEVVEEGRIVQAVGVLDEVVKTREEEQEEGGRPVTPKDLVNVSSTLLSC